MPEMSEKIELKGGALNVLIAALEAAPQDAVVKLGFDFPHSYRGSYDCLAFMPKKNAKVSEMLKIAKSCIDKTFQGYKGGDYRMHEYSDVYLAYYGECGDPLSGLLIGYMLADLVEGGF